jgi:hypothetical protein
MKINGSNIAIDQDPDGVDRQPTHPCLVARATILH